MSITAKFDKKKIADDRVVAKSEAVDDAARDASQDSPSESIDVAVHQPERQEGDVARFVLFISFFVITGLIFYFMWPLVADLFQEGGPSLLVQRAQDAGPLGVLVLLIFQILQVVIAVIPGEAVQMAAGLMYGPWLGALVILVGCVASSAFIYELVHRLGAPFVRSMISQNQFEKFQNFDKSGKLDIAVFVLFLIPGMPKDVITYVIPLTDMKMKDFLFISTVARMPGVIGTTIMASGFATGDFARSIVILGIFVAIGLVAIVFRNQLVELVGFRSAKKKASKD